VSRLVVAALRAMVIVALTAAVSVQIALARGGVEDFDLEHPWFPRVIFAAVVMLAIAAIELALVGIWRLTSLAAHGVAFTPRVFVWVDVVIVGAALGALLGLVLTFFVFTHSMGAPSASTNIYTVGAGAASLFAAVSAQGFVVVKALLAQSVAREEEARQMRAELDEVI